eukprot:1185463-Prorocentrum_minimum.AAC.1
MGFKGAQIEPFRRSSSPRSLRLFVKCSIRKERRTIKLVVAKPNTKVTTTTCLTLRARADDVELRALRTADVFLTTRSDGLGFRARPRWQARTAPVQRLADQVAGTFVYSVMGASAATFAFWRLAGPKLFPAVISSAAAASAAPGSASLLLALQ